MVSNIICTLSGNTHLRIVLFGVIEVIVGSGPYMNFHSSRVSVTLFLCGQLTLMLCSFSSKLSSVMLCVRHVAFFLELQKKYLWHHRLNNANTYSMWTLSPVGCSGLWSEWLFSNICGIKIYKRIVECDISSVVLTVRVIYSQSLRCEFQWNHVNLDNLLLLLWMFL